MKSADPAARELLASVDARPWEVLWRLRLPSALPSIFTTARFAVGLGLAAAYFSEGSALTTDGLGAIGRRAASFNDAETLWTTIVCSALLGIVGLIDGVGTRTRAAEVARLAAPLTTPLTGTFCTARGIMNHLRRQPRDSTPERLEPRCASATSLLSPSAPPPSLAACSSDDDTTGTDTTTDTAPTRAPPSRRPPTATPRASPRSSPARRSPRIAAQPIEAAGTITYLTGFDFAATASIVDVLVAEEKGYYDAMCLDVEVTPSFSTANYPLVAENDAQFASGGSFSEVVSFSAANDADLVVDRRRRPDRNRFADRQARRRDRTRRPRGHRRSASRASSRRAWRPCWRRRV